MFVSLKSIYFQGVKKWHFFTINMLKKNLEALETGNNYDE